MNVKYINLYLHPGQINCIKYALKLAIIQLEETNQKESQGYAKGEAQEMLRIAMQSFQRTTSRKAKQKELAKKKRRTLSRKARQSRKVNKR